MSPVLSKAVYKCTDNFSGIFQSVQKSLLTLNMCITHEAKIIIFFQPQKFIDDSHRAPAQVKIQLETVQEEGQANESNTDTLDRHQYTFSPVNKPKPDAPVNELLSLKP